MYSRNLTILCDAVYISQLLFKLYLVTTLILFSFQAIINEFKDRRQSQTLQKDYDLKVKCVHDVNVSFFRNLKEGVSGFHWSKHIAA